MRLVDFGAGSLELSDDTQICAGMAASPMRMNKNSSDCCNKNDDGYAGE